jgi:predicted ATPase
MERVLCPILIGRGEELSKLGDVLLSANRGEGQVVLLAGDAGVGKTRLANELAERAMRLGMTVVLGGCSEAELALPYLPFLEAVGNHLAGSDIEQVRERLGPVRRELAHL